MSALAKHDPGTAPGLLNVERARAYLAQALSTDELRDYKSKAQRIADHYRAMKAGIESENDAAEIVIRTQRRIGELLRSEPPAKGARPIGRNTMIRPKDDAPTAEERGFSRVEKHRWQKLADIAAPQFEEYIAAVRAKAERLTTAGAIRVADASKPKRATTKRTKVASADVEREPDCGNESEETEQEPEWLPDPWNRDIAIVEVGRAVREAYRLAMLDWPAEESRRDVYSMLRNWAGNLERMESE